MRGIQLPASLEQLRLESPFPSELVKVSLSLEPGISAVGRGEPIICKGNVTVLGVPAFVPIPIAIQTTPRGDGVARPVGMGLTLPLTGTFSISVPTDDWEYDEYAFQALAFVPLGAPGLSAPVLKGVEEPRFSAEVTVVYPETASPRDMDANIGGTVYVSFTLKNTGNRTEPFDIQVYLEQENVLSPYKVYLDLTTQSRKVLLPPGEVYPVTKGEILVPSGTVAPEATYSGVIRVYADITGFPLRAENVQKAVLKLYKFVYASSLTGVVWE